MALAIQGTYLHFLFRRWIEYDCKRLRTPRLHDHSSWLPPGRSETRRRSRTTNSSSQQRAIHNPRTTFSPIRRWNPTDGNTRSGYELHKCLPWRMHRKFIRKHRLVWWKYAFSWFQRSCLQRSTGFSARPLWCQCDAGWEPINLSMGRREVYFQRSRLLFFLCNKRRVWRGRKIVGFREVRHLTEETSKATSGISLTHELINVLNNQTNY